MNGESRPLSRTISGILRYRALPVALALLAASARALPADEVYRSVDSEGHVVFSDQPPDGSAAQRYAVRSGDAQAPPQVIHFCWTNCFTLNFDNGLYRRADGSDETWTVERFTSTSVVLRRHDAPAAWNGFNADVVYEGQVSNGRLVNVTIGGKPASGIDAAWGVALGTLPGSNAERDQGNSPAFATQNLQATSPSLLADGEPAVDDEVRATEAPPPLANDEQPPCSTQGYLWTPGYWAWSVAQRYYWVPGAWVPPPRAGVLWTPGYWQFVGAVFVFHPGYWGPHIGYYGGINYGFGYGGVGFAGGRWVGNSFAYNSAANNLNVNIIRNTYRETVASVTVNKVSFNGGPGGTTAVPTPQERAAAAEPHILPTPLQRQSMLQAANHSALVAKANAAHPAVSMPHRPTVSNGPRAGAVQGTGGQPDAVKPTAARSTKASRHTRQ